MTSKKDTADYVALSHCWGVSRAMPKTTQANLQSNLESIRISELPATFRDAILLTKALGIKYLWIDSLCIVQDDQSDWELESSLMAEIYSNATLTIAATGSSDLHGGCLFDRWCHQRNPPRILSMKSVELKAQVNKSSQAIHVRLLPTAHETFLIGSGFLDRTGALMRRAWAFQERLLSPRIIHFHHEELFWECKASLSCECGWTKKATQEPLKVGYAEILRALDSKQ